MVMEREEEEGARNRRSNIWSEWVGGREGREGKGERIGHSIDAKVPWLKGRGDE